MTGRLPLVRHEHALADQLLALMPQGSEICGFERKAWHSATFAGQILTIKIASNGTSDQALLRAAADLLPQHEFTLPRHFVGQMDAQIVDNDGGDAAIQIAALVIAE